jgi:hypothetical protein
MYRLISPQRGVVVLEADVLVVSLRAVLRQISRDLDCDRGGLRFGCRLTSTAARVGFKRAMYPFRKNPPLHQDACA